MNSEQREQLESLGIVFGERVGDLFVAVTLPDGWQLKPTDHSMWSNLRDKQGRQRASIFYKAAFYDRDAHMSLLRRYSYSYEPEGGWGSDTDTNRYRGVVKDGETVIWSTPFEEADPKTRWELTARQTADAKAWLAANYPDYENPLAYWGDGAA